MRNQYFEITPGRGQSAQLSRGGIQRRNARVLAQRPQQGAQTPQLNTQVMQSLIVRLGLQTRLNFPEFNLVAKELSDERVYKSHIIPCGWRRMGDCLGCSSLLGFEHVSLRNT